MIGPTNALDWRRNQAAIYRDSAAESPLSTTSTPIARGVPYHGLMRWTLCVTPGCPATPRVGNRAIPCPPSARQRSRMPKARLVAGSAAQAPNQPGWRRTQRVERSTDLIARRTKVMSGAMARTRRIARVPPQLRAESVDCYERADLSADVGRMSRARHE